MEVKWVEDWSAEDFASLYNTEVTSVPYSSPVTSTAFDAALQTLSGMTDREELCIVRAEGGLRGFVNLSYGPSENGLGEEGRIRFFLYQRGSRSVGQALIAAVEDRLNSQGVRRIRAFSDFNYSFYNHCGIRLTDGWDHVSALLGANGYEIIPFNVLLESDDVSVSDSESPEGIEIHVNHEECTSELSSYANGQMDQPVIRVEAKLGDEVVGVTLLTNVYYYTGQSDHEDLWEIGALGVKESERRKGIAGNIIGVGLEEAHQRGLSRAIVETGRDNFAAQLLYQRFGFRFVCGNYIAVKDWYKPGRLVTL